MSILDKITGRAKKAAGDVTDSAHLRQQGRKDEAKGEARENQAHAEETAAAERKRAEKLEDQS